MPTKQLVKSYKLKRNILCGMTLSATHEDYYQFLLFGHGSLNLKLKDGTETYETNPIK